MKIFQVAAASMLLASDHLVSAKVRGGSVRASSSNLLRPDIFPVQGARRHRALKNDDDKVKGPKERDCKMSKLKAAMIVTSSDSVLLATTNH